MGSVLVSKKGQVVIPAPLRKKYGIEPATKVEITEIDNKICIIPLPDSPIKGARGMLKMGRKSSSVLFSERRKDKELEIKKNKKWLKN